MCRLCDAGFPQEHAGSRRNFLKVSTATGLGAAALGLLGGPPAHADERERAPDDTGAPGRRTLIRGGAVMSMDLQVGDFAKADVLIEGKKIVAVGPNLHAGGAAVIDARGRIVMP